MTLKEEIRKDKSHLCLFNDTDGVTLPVGSPISMQDYGDKILILSYDNIIYPVPNIYYVSIL